jgi:hypothetical protein
MRARKEWRLSVLRATTLLVGVGLVASLMIGRTTVEVHPEQLERGGQWLSWTEIERNAYAYGLISGYLTGSLEACNAADDLFEVGQPHKLGDQHSPSEMPSARCLAKRDNYSKCKYANSVVDCSAYTTVITEFYTKYPDQRQIAFVDLMRLLSDRSYKSADQLHKMALRGEIRPLS